MRLKMAIQIRKHKKNPPKLIIQIDTLSIRRCTIMILINTHIIIINTPVIDNLKTARYNYDVDDT